MTFIKRLTSGIQTQGSIARYAAALMAAVASFLMIPLTAMQFTNEVNWTVFDFIAAWVLLYGAGMTYKLVARRFESSSFRFGVGLAVGTTLLVTWINLAVGIIGSENNPANDLYFGVILVGLSGAVMSRFRPQGLASTMYAMALAQFLVPIIALMIWRPDFGPGVIKVLILNGFFVILYIGSAMLFRSSVMMSSDKISTGSYGER